MAALILNNCCYITERIINHVTMVMAEPPSTSIILGFRKLAPALAPYLPKIKQLALLDQSLVHYRANTNMLISMSMNCGRTFEGVGTVGAHGL